MVYLSKEDLCTCATGFRKLDEFLQLNDREILGHAGQISAKKSEEIAHRQYDLYCRLQNESELGNSVASLEGAVRQLAPKRKAKHRE